MVRNLNENSIDNFINTEDKLVIVDIQAAWCGPCKILGPIIEELSIEFENHRLPVTIGKIDAEYNRDKVIELGITNIPTLLFYKNGELLGKNVGMIQKTKLKEMIENYL